MARWPALAAGRPVSGAGGPAAVAPCAPALAAGAPGPDPSGLGTLPAQAATASPAATARPLPAQRGTVRAGCPGAIDQVPVMLSARPPCPSRARAVRSLLSCIFADVPDTAETSPPRPRPAGALSRPGSLGPGLGGPC